MPSRAPLAVLFLVFSFVLIHAALSGISTPALQSNGVDANPGSSGPDDQCPPGGTGAHGDSPVAGQTKFCFNFTIGFPIPLPRCPEEGIPPFNPLAGGVSASVGTMGHYDQDPSSHFEATAYSQEQSRGLDSPYVDAVSGELLVLETDLSLDGRYFNALVSRTYRSSNFNYEGIAGLGWEINTNRNIQATAWNAADEPTAFEMAAGNGLSTESFQRKANSNWFEGARGGVAEFKAGSGVTVYHKTGLAENFEDFGGGTWYFPTGYIDTWGQSGSMSYTASVTSPTGYKLTTMTDDIGRTYVFSYHSGHGRLESIAVQFGGQEIARVDFTHLERANGQVTLEKVEGLKIATENPSGQLTFTRNVREYTYIQDAVLGAWLLNGVKNGEGQLEHSWGYESGGTARVQWQKDRPGSTLRAEGMHGYTYHAGYTTYQGPDGEQREFHFDAHGRIEKRRDLVDLTQQVWRELLFEYTDPNCSSCEILTKVTFPDGSWQEMQYDAGGNLTTKWWYPPAGSLAPKRVERWAYAVFNPEGGEKRTRLLEHELQRDAHHIEDPNYACNHPNCDQAANLEGHIVHFYNWSSDKLKLESKDLGQIRKSGTNGNAMVHRQLFFEYFAGDGRLKRWRQSEDSLDVTETTMTLSASGNYVATRQLADPVNATSWTTTIVKDDAFLRTQEETGHDGVTTAYSRDQGGRVYWVGEAYHNGATARDNHLRYDKAGRLVKLETKVPGGLTELRTLGLDEMGFPLALDYTGPGGSPKTTQVEWTAGGRFSSSTDWRGWKTSTEYGEGAFMLPVRSTETFGTKTRTVWEAGALNEAGYDSMGRLLLWTNPMGWKNYQTYDGHGRLKRRFEQTRDDFYDAWDLQYDARGFVEEMEVGAIQGTPSSPTGSQWHEHHVLTHNLAGHLLSSATYEGGAVDEARRVRYLLDGRGRAEREIRVIGDRAAGPASAKGVTREWAYDAKNRAVYSALLSNGVGSAAVEELFYDHLDLQQVTEVERVSDGGLMKEKTRTAFDALGRPSAVTDYEWLTGGYTGNTRQTTFLFDGLDRMTKRTDPMGVTVQWGYDDLSRVTSESRVSSLGALQTTTYLFDATHGFLDQVTDAEGKVTDYSVDTGNWLRPTQVTYPDGRWLQNTSFDDLDRVLSTLDSRGITHDYTFKYRDLTKDDTNVEMLSNVIGDDELVWEYDDWDGTMTKSEVWRGGVKMWETVMTHNDLGERISETQGMGGHAATWNWTYGFGGELRKTSYPGGLGLDNATLDYDAAGRLQTASYTQNGNPFASYSMSHLGTRVSGRQETTSQIGANFGFDGYGRWTSAQWEYQAGAQPIVLDGEIRMLDDASRVTSRQRVMDSVGDVLVHDDFGRMKEWYAGVPNANQSPQNAAPATWVNVERYTLDSVYARDSVEAQDFGQPPVTTNYTTGLGHHYEQVGTESRTVQAGCLNSDGIYYYRWGAWGKLVEVEEIATGTVIRRHEYDATGRRVRTHKTAGGQTNTTRHVYRGAGLAVSWTEGVQKTDIRTHGYLLRGDEETLVVIQESSLGATVNGSYELVKDVQGSILALVDRADGQLVERYRYTPWGEVTIEDGAGNALADSAYGQKRFFLNRPFDPELELYDLRNRWYEPDTGAFLSPDPLLAVDSWNMYQYGFGAPATWMDPFGLSAQNPEDQSPSDQNPEDQEPEGATKPPPTDAQCTAGFVVVDGARYGVMGTTVLAFPGSGNAWWSQGQAVSPKVAKKVLGELGRQAAGAKALLSSLASFLEGLGATGAAILVGSIAICVVGYQAALEAADAAPNKKEEGVPDPEEETVEDRLKKKRGSIKKAKLPQGSPSWDKIGKLTMAEIARRAAKNEKGYKAIKKLLNDIRFDK